MVKKPFFSRYLESESTAELAAAQRDLGGAAATAKYPSDTDEIIYTLQWPSDNDEPKGP